MARHSATKKETGEYLGMRVTRSVQDSEMSSSRPSVDEAVSVTCDSIPPHFDSKLIELGNQSTMIDDLYIFVSTISYPSGS